MHAYTIQLLSPQMVEKYTIDASSYALDTTGSVHSKLTMFNVVRAPVFELVFGRETLVIVSQVEL